MNDHDTRENTFDHAAALTTSFDEIPVIDISRIGPNTEVGDPVALQKVADEIHEAATDVGFFYVSGHGIDEDIIDHAMQSTRTFFSLPSDEKEKIVVNQQQRGWMPSGMAKLEGAVTHDLKEVFFYGTEVAADDPDLLAGVPLVALNQWPSDESVALKQSVQRYHSALCDVGARVLSAIAVSFGLPKNLFESHYQKPLARGQLVYYPPSQADDEKAQRFGVAPHTDFGVLTLLYQDNSGGLQVKARTGEWIEAPPIPGTLVVNTGDLLQRWTNDRFESTLHRVINRSGKARYSMPVFYDPASTAIIDPAELGVNRFATNHPPISAGDHIQSRNRRNFTQYRS